MNRWDLAGWVAILGAVCLQVGLLVGAETTPVFPPTGAMTPGVFDDSVSVGPFYTMLWRLATISAVAGLGALIFGRREQLFDEIHQMKK